MERFQYALLEAPWHSCYQLNDSDSVIESWMNLFRQTAESYIAHYPTTIWPHDKEFVNSTIQHLMLERDRLHKQTKSSLNDNNLKEQYKRVRNRVVTEIEKAKFEHEKKRDIMLSSTDMSPKKWWHLHKTTLSHGNITSINNTPFLDINNIVTENYAKANLLNQTFINQTLLDESQVQLLSDNTLPETEIEQKVIQPEDIYEILINLDTSKATGPDGISNKHLREAAVPISQPLSELFNYSLSTGYFPDTWKLAHVILILKKRKSDDMQ